MDNLKRKRVSQDYTDGYILAAAVMDAFNPDSIKPLVIEGEREQTQNLTALLSTAVVTQTGSTNFEWRVSDDTRKSAIGFLGKRRLLKQAMDLNDTQHDSKSVYQRMFENYVHGTAPALNEQSLDELQASLQAVHLLGNVIEGMPNEKAVAAHVRKKMFLQQFRLLADEHFMGRQGELRRLERFVDVLPISGLRSVGRMARNFASNTLGFKSVVRHLPLLVIGPGGMGKSAFLAKFLLNHVTLAPGGDFAFAYIDFDRSAIWPDEPLTILADIAAQLANQTGSSSAEFLQLQQDIAKELFVGQTYSADYDSYESFSNASLSERREERHYRRFRELIESVFEKGREITLLLLLDTFEEVTQRTDIHLSILWEFFADLQILIPRLRVVISGRTDLPREIKHERLDLAPLDPQCAGRLLESYGVSDGPTIQAILDRVGGHPLSLRLTAQLIHAIAEKDRLPVGEVSVSKLFAEQWSQHLAEGILYRRIVDHIEDPVVKKLTNPGFVLREVTPTLILEVLNQPCDLGLQTLDEAKNVFAKLAVYNSLVSQRSEWILRHRPEVRRMILDSLLTTNRKLCELIWHKAIKYYAHQSGTKNRAEEIYCCLMLDENPENISVRWEPGVEKHLMNVRNELPERGRDLLDYRIMLADSGKRDFRSLRGDVAILRRMEGMKLLLARGRSGEALDLYREVAGEELPDPMNPLFPMVARAYAQASDIPRALAMAIQGMDALEQLGLGRSEEYTDLLLLACQISLASARPLRPSGLVIFKQKNPGSESSMPASHLFKRFSSASVRSHNKYQHFRVVVHLLELIELEELMQEGRQRNEAYAGIADYLPPPSSLFKTCAAAALKLMSSIDFEQEDIDAMLILRAFSWLGAYYPENPRIRSLLAIQQVRSVFSAEFARVLLDKDIKLRGESQIRYQNQTLIETIGRAISADAMKEWLDSGELSDDELRHFALLLKDEIRVRDLQDRYVAG
jgi:hypothetical protein